MKRSIAGIVAATALWGASVESTVENSNFTLSLPLDSSGERVWYNYNRLRGTFHLREENWFLTAIGDIDNHLGQDFIHSPEYALLSSLEPDTPFRIQSDPYRYGEGEVMGQLYRLYGGYADETHRLSVGVQKVSFGVGRIWNPTDLFNPKNPFALEPDEVYGIFGASYTYSFGDLSQVSAVAAQRADQSFKYAGRIKSNVELVDMALSAVSADDMGMIGYEIEGELLDTGIELRSEGGWFDDKLLGQRYVQALFGADYGFANSLTLAAEWLHTSRTFENAILLGLPSGSAQNLVRSRDYFGVSGGYQVDPLLYGSFAGIVNGTDGSFYMTPSLSYSLDDDMSVKAGAMLYGGSSGSEFGGRGETYYLNFKVTF